jgi:hypothetical protein
MVDWRRIALVGAPTGLISGAVFGLVIYVLAFLLISGHETLNEFGSAGITLVVVFGAAFGILTGMGVALFCALVRNSFGARSSIKGALVGALLLAFPWGLAWLFIIPLSGTAIPTHLVLFIHHFGIETPWVNVNTSPPQINELAGFLSAGAYFATYILAVLMWIMLSGGFDRLRVGRKDPDQQRIPEIGLASFLLGQLLR